MLLRSCLWNMQENTQILTSRCEWFKKWLSLKQPHEFKNKKLPSVLTSTSLFKLSLFCLNLFSSSSRILFESSSPSDKERRASLTSWSSMAKSKFRNALSKSASVGSVITGLIHRYFKELNTFIYFIKDSYFHEIR